MSKITKCRPLANEFTVLSPHYLPQRISAKHAGISIKFGLQCYECQTFVKFICRL